MSDLRNLIGYLKAEVAEESERLQDKNATYLEWHRRGMKGSDYHRDCGIIEGLDRVMAMIESWCEQNGIDYEDILGADPEDWEEDL